MDSGIQITLLGELRVTRDGRDVALPASRKARALLAFLVATGRPHRRERLCELFWDLPDDPKAALRWALTKLRKVVDSPDQPRILADRERVSFDTSGIDIDIRAVQTRLRNDAGALSVEELEDMARKLDMVLLDGLDGAGDAAIESWLMAEREDARAAQAQVLNLLATHPAVPPLTAAKWDRLWRESDPAGAEASDLSASSTGVSRTAAGFPLPPRTPERVTPMGGRVATISMSPRRLADTSESLRAQRIGFCEVPDGTKIGYATIGSGPPLLKAANWLTHLELDWASPIWGKGFAEIARARTFIRYDERGCGLSDWDVQDLSFDAFVEDLETVVETLGLEKFPLLGISQGAAVSIDYAVRHPDRVSGLILIGGYAAGWRHLASPEEHARREAVRNLTEVGWGTDNPAYRHIFSQTFMPDAGAEDLEWFDEFQRLTTSPRNAARFQDAFGDIDVRGKLGQVKVPTLVLHARDDQRIALDQGRALASGIPGAHFVPLESRNHVLVDYEPAWTSCMKAVRDFLAEYNI
ncbi:MAG: alpha/beta fold hydrolase [Sulfitobacter sp.]